MIIVFLIICFLKIINGEREKNRKRKELEKKRLKFRRGVVLVK